MDHSLNYNPDLDDGDPFFTPRKDARAKLQIERGKGPSSLDNVAAAEGRRRRSS